MEPFPNIEADTETPNEMDTETDTETDIETDTETNTETDTETDAETHAETARTEEVEHSARRILWRAHGTSTGRNSVGRKG